MVVTAYQQTILFGILLAAVGNARCSRADVYAITAGPGDDANNGQGASDGSLDAPSPAQVACPTPARTAGNTTEMVQVDALRRTFVLHIPPTYDGRRRVPLVVDFHRMRGSGSSQMSSSPYPPTTDPDGVVMAFPDGREGPFGTDWNLGPCCVADVDDVAFARALVARVQETVCIDPDRVYATGATTGGGMVHYLACHAADVFAAMAPAGFDLLQENVDDCHPTRPISVVSFRGTEESMVPYAGGLSAVVPRMSVTLLGAEKTFETWARIDQCTAGPSSEDSQGCSSYAGCEGGVDVILCTEQGSRDEARDAVIAWSVLKRHARTNGL